MGNQHARRRLVAYALVACVAISAALFGGCADCARTLSDAQRIAITKEWFDSSISDEESSDHDNGDDGNYNQYLLQQHRRARAVLEGAQASDFAQAMPVSANFYKAPENGIGLVVVWLCSDDRVTAVYVEDSDGHTLATGQVMTIYAPAKPEALGLVHIGFSRLIPEIGNKDTPVLKLDLNDLGKKDLRVGLIEPNPAKKSDPIGAYVENAVRKMAAENQPRIRIPDLRPN